MKTIYLVGKLNAFMQELNGILSGSFDVQLCSENAEFLKGMLEVEEPDLVVVSLVGLEQSHGEIFKKLKFGYSHIPVICLGTRAEQAAFEEFMDNGQFQAAERPIGGQELTEAVLSRLENKRAPERVTGRQPEGGRAKKNILLVDDNAIQLRSLKSNLQNLYDISMATSGAEAMKQIGKRRPDLIFLDYEMPECDGKMTLEMIRNVEGNEDIPVVFLTGVNDSGHIAAVLKLKPAGYLLKPASIEKILDIIHKLIGG